MKRVLFLTYYFPPSGGPGVQRSLKFVRYLPQSGWRPVVVTVDPSRAAYPALDRGLEKEIPSDLHVIRTSARDPYAGYARFFGRKKDDMVGVGFLSQKKPGFRERMARWIRANLFLPDARKGWNPYATRAAMEFIQNEKVDAIFSTGPPHSTHLIAKRLHERSSTPWIADLRDAWPPDSYAHLLPMSNWARKRDHGLRAGVLNGASLIITVSQSLAGDIQGMTRTPVEVIPNGFDGADFTSISPIRNEPFTIVYAGNLSAEQNPIALWHAIKWFQSKGAWEDVRVSLVGNVAVEVKAAIEQAGLTRRVDYVPYVEHEKAVRYMCGADLLLLAINRVPNPAGIVTGKMYEYLATERPILCLSPPGTDAANIINQFEAGECFRYEDGNGVGQMVDRHYRAWKNGSRLKGTSVDKLAIYSREAQAGRLSELLDQVSEEGS